MEQIHAKVRCISQSSSLCCFRHLQIPFALFYESNLDPFKKKKNFCHLWIHIREILVPSLSDFELAEMFELIFGLEYHLLSSMNPILTFQKPHLVSFPRMRFATFVPSGASTPFRVYCIRNRHICISTLYHFTLSELCFSVN